MIDEEHARAGRGDVADAAPSRGVSAVSRPAAGSSSSSTVGSDAHARAIDTSWRWPWLSSPACRSRRSASAGAVERGGRAVVAVLVSSAEHGGADVLLDGEVVVELERLERARQPSSHPRVGRERVDRSPLQRNAAVRAGEARDRVDDARLARAVRSDESDDLPGRRRATSTSSTATDPAVAHR